MFLLLESFVKFTIFGVPICLVILFLNDFST